MMFDYLRRAITSPMVLIGLVIDLLPVFGVMFLGWDAAGLVMLYWLETLIIGLFCAPRIVMTGGNFGMIGVIGGMLASGVFLILFGLFASLHGSLLAALLSATGAVEDRVPFMNLQGLVPLAFGTAPHLIWMLALMGLWQAYAMVRGFVGAGRVRGSHPGVEMAEPFVWLAPLHVVLAILAGLMLATAQPLWGVLGLVGIRALWGAALNAPRQLPRTDETVPESAAAPAW